MDYCSARQDRHVPSGEITGSDVIRTRPELVYLHAVKMTGTRPAAAAACGYAYSPDGLLPATDWLAQAPVMQRCPVCTAQIQGTT
ncbi:MAG: hypothetical protein ACHP9Z_29730 [Streptosporangiales bacterium]